VSKHYGGSIAIPLNRREDEARRERKATHRRDPHICSIERSRRSVRTRLRRTMPRPRKALAIRSPSETSQNPLAVVQAAPACRAQLFKDPSNHQPSLASNKTQKMRSLAFSIARVYPSHPSPAPQAAISHQLTKARQKKHQSKIKTNTNQKYSDKIHTHTTTIINPLPALTEPSLILPSHTYTDHISHSRH